MNSLQYHEDNLHDGDCRVNLNSDGELYQLSADKTGDTDTGEKRNRKDF